MFYRYDNKEGKRVTGDKNFPKNVRFLTVAVTPKNVGSEYPCQPFYLTCLHLDHRLEPHRLKELEIIKSTIASLVTNNSQNNTPHVWVGDFNSLTQEDYTIEEWNKITRVRQMNCWEKPHVDVTNKVYSNYQMIDEF